MSPITGSDLSKPNKIIKDVNNPIRDNNFGKVLGQIGLRCINGASPASILNQAV